MGFQPFPAKGKPGLACLVLAAMEGDDDLLLSVAAWLGYELKSRDGISVAPPQEKDVSEPDTSVEVKKKASPEPALSPRSYLPYPFWRLSRIISTAQPDASDGRPQWLKIGGPEPSQPPTTERESHCRLPWPDQLVPMKRIWPMLINDLSCRYRTRQPDTARVVRKMALAGVLAHIPLLKRRRWSDDIQVIVDTAEHLFPFRADCMRLVADLRQRIGRQRLRIIRFSDYPGGRCESWYLDDHGIDGQYQPPHANGRVLILSDLSISTADSGRADQWKIFIEGLKGAGIPVYLFSPAAAGNYPAHWREFLKIQSWNPGACFRRHIGSPGREHLPAATLEQLEKLKVLLSCTALFDGALLRKFRAFLLPQAPPELESLLWQQRHFFLFQGSLASWRADRLGSYREQFRQEESGMKQAVLKLRDDHFRNFPQDFLAVQDVLAASVTSGNAKEAQKYLQAMLCREFSRRQTSTSTRSFFGFFLENQDEHAWQQDDDLLHTAWLLAHEDEIEQGEMPDRLPRGFNPDKIRWHGQQARPGVLFLYQQRDSLICEYATAMDSTTVPDQPGIRYPTVGQPLWQDDEGVWRPLGRKRTFDHKKQPLIINVGDHRQLELEAFIRPSWAMAIGRDQYGLYLDLSVKSIIQRFRWCEPGIFQMGSPPDEPERWGGSEVLHEVTLSRGFWLADTAVTQGLWQAVMGDNPSKFQGVERPVEQVSWKDAQDFIKKLNAMVPGLSARLPWEAEWEYACRAGTTTPFSFGGKEDLTLDRVNYSGKWDKMSSEGETKVVKTYAPNPWGLYEMHGNVWEWCQDYYPVDLGAEPVVDPQGPDTGYNRVVRGGSWISFGRFVPSAYRVGAIPGHRVDNQGFRLALDHELK